MSNVVLKQRCVAILTIEYDDEQDEWSEEIDKSVIDTNITYV